jgi:hypothetical protein
MALKALLKEGTDTTTDRHHVRTTWAEAFKKTTTIKGVKTPTTAHLPSYDPCKPISGPLAELLAHTLASGRERITNREILWRLRVPGHNEHFETKNIARVLRSLGWVKVRYGPQAKRVWGWRWREWNVSHLKIDLDS